MSGLGFGINHVFAGGPKDSSLLICPWLLLSSGSVESAVRSLDDWRKWQRPARTAEFRFFIVLFLALNGVPLYGSAPISFAYY